MFVLLDLAGKLRHRPFERVYPRGEIGERRPGGLSRRLRGGLRRDFGLGESGRAGGEDLALDRPQLLLHPVDAHVERRPGIRGARRGGRGEEKDDAEAKADHADSRTWRRDVGAY